MTHRRKQFLVYPPNYDPFSGKRFKVRLSKRQAWKLARKFGEGAEIMETVRTHPARRKPWNSYQQSNSWGIVKSHEIKV